MGENNETRFFLDEIIYEIYQDRYATDCNALSLFYALIKHGIWTSLSVRQVLSIL